jgi:hypothetical protein
MSKQVSGHFRGLFVHDIKTSDPIIHGEPAKVQWLNPCCFRTEVHTLLKQFDNSGERKCMPLHWSECLVSSPSLICLLLRPHPVAFLCLDGIAVTWLFCCIGVILGEQKGGKRAPELWVYHKAADTFLQVRTFMW